MVEWAAANIAQTLDKDPRHPHDEDHESSHNNKSITTQLSAHDNSSNNNNEDGKNNPTGSFQTKDDSNLTMTSTTDGGGGSSSKRRRVRPSETPEAALARLTSSYSTAMSAVGALHKCSHEYVAAATDNAPTVSKDDFVDTSSEWEAIQRVSRAARDAFEHAVLSDPLIQPYCPTFSHTLIQRNKQLKSDHDGHTNTMDMPSESSSRAHGQSRSRLTLKEDVKKIASSAAHKNTLKELAYASLLNYADLLICGCAKDADPAEAGSSVGILDRGVVKALQALLHKSEGCTTESLWRNFENEEWTMRLVVVAYCDAADLDGSDPTIWLKLACAARRLGFVEKKRLLARVEAQDRPSCARTADTDDVNSGMDGGGEAMDIDTDSSMPLSLNLKAGTNYIKLGYERLERYALERGLTSLRSGLPPNRTIIKAFQEFESEKVNPPTHHSTSTTSMHIRTVSNTDCAYLIIDLPRYSWYSLGRSLIRACNSGVTSNQQDGWTIQKSWKSLAHKGNDFASPSVQVKISPLLAIPRKILALTCEFLGADVRMLESTCRSLSVDIISARALIEKDRTVRMKQMEQEMGDMLKETEMDELMHDEGTKADSSTKQSLMKFAHRSSKRVRSQLITSGKQAERSAKRKSVEYCLISSIIPCTIDHPGYIRCLNEDFDWDNLNSLHGYAEKVKLMSQVLRKEESINLVADKGSTLLGAERNCTEQAWSGNTSLTTFIKTWSRINSGARDMLHRFLAHISCYVNHVYTCEEGNVMMLSQCITECFDILFASKITSASINPSWYGEDIFIPTEKNLYLGIETLAMNLLSTELKMRTCERHGIKIVSYSDNVQAVRTNIPHLLQYAEAIMQCDMEFSTKQIVAGMQTRCYWLAGIFYVWWSKNAVDLADVKELEVLALEFIDKAIRSLQAPLTMPIAFVLTPHLKSHGRVGNHWSELSVESLSSYRNQIESSTVISRVRQRFQDIATFFERCESLSELPDNVNTHFESIEKDLFERYLLHHDSQGQNYDELVHDFGNRYRQDLSNKTAPQRESKDDLVQDSVFDRWGVMWNSIPSEGSNKVQLVNVRDPALLTMVVLCYHKRKDKFASNVTRFLQQLIVFVLEKRAKLLDKKKNSSTDFAIADDSDSSSDENDSTGGDDNAFDPSLLLRLSHFLLAKLGDIVVNCDLAEFDTLKEHSVSALKVAIECSSGMLPTSNRSSTCKEFLHVQPNIEILNSAISTISTMLHRVDTNGDSYRSILTTTFSILARIIVHGKKIMVLLLGSRDKNRLGRSECHALVMLRAKYIATVASELASMLSHHANKFQPDGTIVESFLIKNLMQLNEPLNGADKNVSPVVSLAESLSWLWGFLSSAESVDASSTSRYAAITNTIHKYAANHLLVPIAGAITSLVGSVGHGPKSLVSRCFGAITTSRATNESGDHFSLSDFFASDESAKEWIVSGDDGEVLLKEKRRLLQTLSKTVQCVSLVFSNYEDGELSIQPPCIIFPMKEGLFLPLMVSRVLTSISDFVLVEFAEEKKSRSRDMAIWDDEYPFGFRSAGIQLDFLLHRAYRCLHGITMSAAHLTAHVAKDAVYPAANTSPPAGRLCYLPPSTTAAIQMYRCLKRAYCNSRRTIPADALGCISSSLPKERESEKEAAIKTFIFGKPDEVAFCTSLESPSNIMDDLDVFNDHPPDFPSWLLEHEHHTKNENDSLHDHISIVQKGIAEYIATGPMPAIGLNSEDNSGKYIASEQPLKERRAVVDLEVASGKMLQSIIKALHYDPSDEKKWYRAGLIIGVKLNVILDRLIPAERGLKLDQFSPPTFDSNDEKDLQWAKERGHPRNASKLLKDQRRAYKKICSRRGLIGTNLEAFMDHQFCNPKSLKALQNSWFKTFYNESNSGKNKKGEHISLLLSIISKFENGKYSEWQHQWGTLFVAALRLMRHRCFQTAIMISKKNDISVRGDSIYSEVVEAMGTAFYNSIGFSAREQSNFEKRRKAQMASACYHCALDYLRSSFDKSSGSVPATWELLFMIGKCAEKIAYTLKEEQVLTDGIRLYEKFLDKALSSYNLAVVEGKAFTSDGNTLEFQGGGSSHGITEMVYRLHASRLKTLLAAVKSVRHERNYFISEALRITSKHWFNKAPDGFEDMDLNDQLWEVFCDVVDAIASARREQPFFHRSVYRHAQAMLWAPIFHDPDGCLKGCLESVPAHKAHRIQGLGSGPCVNSAEPIINTLFDKKRPQIVAVWVTTPASPTPFEVINESSRKFDRLRCKYITAFIECMYLTRRNDALESLIKWTYAVPRDLPGFYDLSCRGELGYGDILAPTHSKDNLLAPTHGLIFFTKKFANAALCRIAMQTISNFNSNDFSLDEKKLAMRSFYSIYKCFGRLNCPIYNILWQSQQIRYRLSIGSVPEAIALCDAFNLIYGDTENAALSVNMSWEQKMDILLSATLKGQEMSEAAEADVDDIKRDRKKRKILDM